MVDRNRHGKTAERSGSSPVFSMQIVGIAGRTGMSLHQQHFRRLWSTTIGLGFLGFGRLDTFFLKRFFTVLEDWLYMGKETRCHTVSLQFTEINLGNWDQSRVFVPMFFFSEWFTTYHYSRRFLLGDFFHIRVQFFNSGDGVVGPRQCLSWPELGQLGQLGVFEVVSLRWGLWHGWMCCLWCRRVLHWLSIEYRIALPQPMVLGGHDTWLTCSRHVHVFLNVQVFVSRAANILRSCFSFTPKINFMVAESVLSGVGTFKEHGRSPMPLSKEDERWDPFCEGLPGSTS